MLRWVRDEWRWSVSLAVAAITVVTLFGALLPWTPSLPTDTTLDSSWIAAMNEAIARKIPHGSGLVFTFGPYASIYTREYHPATSGLMWGGSLLLAAAWSGALLLLGLAARPLRLTLCALAIAGLTPGWDALLLAYVLLAGLVVYVRHVRAEPRASRRAWETWALALLLVPLGLLPLIKGSLLAAVVGQLTLCAAALAWMRRPGLAAVCAAVPPAACLALWLLADQSPGALPGFFVNQLRIVSGYTDAMSGGWTAREIVLYLLAALLLIHSFASEAGRPRWERGYLALSLGLFLFLAFKAGFVRHDPHALIAGGALWLAALLACLVQARAPLAGVAMCVLGWYTIDEHFRGTTVQSVRAALASTYAPLRGAPGAASVAQQLHLRRAELERHCPLPRLDGTSDIYSFRQACLLYSSNRWSPRPVFQSYAAYTPELAELNARHLRGPSAPDNVFLAVEAIDGRLPALEDGHSWPTLLETYDIHGWAESFLVLRRRAVPHPRSEPREIYRAEHAVGEPILLPRTSSVLLAEIDVRPSLLGRAATLLFKSPPLELEVRTTAGERRKYRFVPGMARASFPLSPLVDDTREFLLLAARDPGFFGADRVLSMRLRTHSRAYWASRFLVRLSEIELPPADPAAAALLFEPRVDLVAEPGAVPVACDGFIDTLNDAPAGPELSAAGELRARGWMAVSAKDGVLAERTLLALRAPDGTRSFFATRHWARPDVGAYLGRPELSRAGFQAILDLSRLEGSYELNAAHVQEGKLTLCEPTRTLTVTR